MFVSWRRIRQQDAVYAYASRTLVITPDGRTAYAVNRDSGTVTPISVATGRALPSITIRGNPDGIAIAPDGRTAYVIGSAAGSGPSGTVGVVTPVDTRAQAARRATTISGQPVAIVIAP